MARLKDFIEKYKKEIIAKLIPGLSVNGVTIALVSLFTSTSKVRSDDNVF